MEASPHALYLCPSSPQEVRDRFRVRTEHRVTRRVELPHICYCSPTSCHKPLISRALLCAVLSKVYLEMNKTPSPHDGSTPSHRCLSTLLRGHSAPETLASLLFPRAHRAHSCLNISDLESLYQESPSPGHSFFHPLLVSVLVRSSLTILYQIPPHPQHPLPPSK